MTDAGSERDLLAELGVRRVINASGYYTFIGGSLMSPRVTAAYAQTAGTYARVAEVGEAAGRRVAALLGAEAALVTAGAAAALTLGTAACLTGSDPARIRRLPDTSGMPNEVIVQRAHRFSYDHAVRACGVRMIEIETTAELEAAVTERTAMLLFLNLAETRAQIGPEQFTAIAKRHHVPTLIDCAADVPPLETLARALANGFDLVAVSGGKAIGGPQNAGLLLGRADLIAAASMNAAPNADVIGRAMKVNKETIVAMVVAIEDYAARDHAADWREWDRRVAAIAGALAGIAGVTTERFVPPVASHAPHLCVRWDRAVIPLKLVEAVERLREGEPSVEVGPIEIPPEARWAAIGPADGLNVAVWTLQPGETEVVAERIAEVLETAGRG